MKRLLYLAAAVIVIGLGLASRRFRGELPPFIGTYSGDALWALMMYLLVSTLVPGRAIRTRALIAMGISTLVEISQLYHAPWIDAIRHTTLGGLVLGFGFLWSDLVCYAVGITAGASIEWGFLLTRKRSDL
ncbi:DUF2809 domain-containing protein [Blastopirellula marina]|uniref:DUF2809 domain-containing protein n=1 Tax=Blastopirellula marina TaxID=124 RepID=A0A2S8GLD0_9BACT|nr:DUF2809 domain-containing protein [Blastopirellula marina]PQO45242.1 DUF2809 domain-containing protein [Blastopirellula marina]